MATNGSDPFRYHPTFTLPSGSIVHTWLCDSPRAIIVLQHGFGEYAERYVKSHAELIPTLNINGFEVWAMDLWGHGRSPGTRGMVNVRLAVKDHLQVRLRAAEKGFRVFLMGHSLGGLITAVSVAKNSSSASDGVILCSPALPATMMALGEHAISLVARLAPTIRIPIPKSPLEELSHDTHCVRQASQDSSMYKGQISFLVAATALHEARQMWPILRHWTKPTLIMHGTSDSYTKHEQSEHFVREIASEDKTLHLIKEGYHELLNDADYESTLQTVLGWLESQLC
ncbi:Alpha/Beta hydrolase protein [Colletotrichum acutatum]|uniref:Alpha/Beta hydrolase protein n=1 Tax=Glomerella acutata TaxID=27357 RepID=A0AAD8XGX7_GLOAC|nr:Alpha/Beta hydrolase protein [Colletotrichum acutatum]KAK1722955.1 Alpha/Beta hydrolase protein [Colletotrichum acutatum]